MIPKIRIYVAGSPCKLDELSFIEYRKYCDVRKASILYGYKGPYKSGLPRISLADFKRVLATLPPHTIQIT